MESSDEGEFEVVSTGDFAKAEDEIKYLKSIVQELESRNREQTITLENITDEVCIHGPIFNLTMFPNIPPRGKPTSL